jgi:hypothetical protein
MIRTILDQLESDMGSELPNDYVCFDLETTGFRKDDDLIVEMGNCIVEQNAAQYYESHVLNWADPKYRDVTPRDWVKWKLKKCAEQMAKAGRTCHMTIDRMEAEGEDPIEVLETYVEIFQEWRAPGHFFVGHNVLNFDASRIEFTTGEWLGHPWVFQQQELFDTAAVEKAIVTGIEPMPGEPIYKYFKRVLDRPAPGVRWAMEPTCVEKYQLAAKYPDLNMDDAHSAGFDSMLVHLLFEEFREMADADVTNKPVTNKPRRRAKRIVGRKN